MAKFLQFLFFPILLPIGLIIIHCSYRKKPREVRSILARMVFLRPGDERERHVIDLLKVLYYPNKHQFNPGAIHRVIRKCPELMMSYQKETKTVELIFGLNAITLQEDFCYTYHSVLDALLDANVHTNTRLTDLERKVQALDVQMKANDLGLKANRMMLIYYLLMIMNQRR